MQIFHVIWMLIAEIIILQAFKCSLLITVQSLCPLYKRGPAVLKIFVIVSEVHLFWNHLFSSQFSLSSSQILNRRAFPIKLLSLAREKTLTLIYHKVSYLRTFQRASFYGGLFCSFHIPVNGHLADVSTKILKASISVHHLPPLSATHRLDVCYRGFCCGVAIGDK